MGAKITHEIFIANVMKRSERVHNGEIEIRGKYTRSQDRIECYCNIHDVLWNPIASSLYKNIGCKECANEEISKKNSKSHDEFVNDMAVLNDGIKILTQYTGMDEDITVELRCGHVWTTKAAYVYYKNFQCPYCTGNAILVGFNDLWTTAPDAALLLTDPNDGYLVSRGSGQKKNFTCPLCNKVQLKYVKNVATRGFQCTYCGDGISYPNKFGRAFLDQVVGNDYIPEYSPDWANPYFFDNYFEYRGENFILEMDGGFHYDEINNVRLTLEKRQAIDRIKDALAKEHNIVIIRIDCRESDRDYIKANMFESKLNEIFDLSQIDWQQCDMKAQRNLTKEACDLYMSGIKSTKEISKIIKVGISATIRYLKKGAQFGWCDYDPKKAHIGLPNKKLRKPILVTNIQNGKEYYFDSVSLCENTSFDVCGVKISKKSIYDYLKSGKPFKGFTFQYINSTIQN